MHQLLRVMYPVVGNNMVAIISYHVTRFFRNRAVTVNERNRPHDAIDWSRNRDQSAQETRARSTTRYFRYFRLRQSYIYILPFCTHTWHESTWTHIRTRTYTCIQPRFIFHRRFCSTLLPSSRLTFFRVPPYPSRSLKPPAFSPDSVFVFLHVCMCVFKCANVCASPYNSAQICFNKGGTESLEYHSGLN